MSLNYVRKYLLNIVGVNSHESLISPLSICVSFQDQTMELNLSYRKTDAYCKYKVKRNNEPISPVKFSRHSIVFCKEKKIQR